MQGVIERAQIRIDLLRQRAGQEAESLTGLDRRASKHNARNPLSLQRLNRLGDSEVGLAGARRADAEDDRVLVDGIDVVLLVHGLRSNRATTIAQDVRAQDLGRPLARAQKGDGSFDVLDAQRLSSAQKREHLAKQDLDQGDVGRSSGDRDLIASHQDVGITERCLDQAQVLITRAKKSNHGLRGGDGNHCLGMRRPGGCGCRND